MKKTIKTLLLTVLTLITTLMFGVACHDTTSTVEATISVPEYLVVKTGKAVSLSGISAMTDSGDSCEFTIEVVSVDGESVAVEDNSFTPQKTGKYTVTVKGGKGVTATSKNFYVYATADGFEYTITPPTNIPQTAEWGKECVLPLATATHVMGDTAFADIKVYDSERKEIPVTSDRFVPNALGEYTVKYFYGGGEYATTISCVDTSAPIVILRNNATATPVFGDDFLLPIIGVIDAQEDESKRIVKVYSEDSESEVPIVDGRINVDASKYFTYYIYAEDANGLSAEYEFIITRAYNATIDTFPLAFEGNIVKWEDRTVQESKAGYRQVTGYNISLDGGATIATTVDKNVNEYEINSSDFCSIVVTELSENNTRESAVSKTLLFDGELPENVLANFNRSEYTGVISQGAYDLSNKGYTWNYENSLSVSVNTDGYNDGEGENVTSGVLVLNNPNPCQVKISFPKQNDKLVGDSVLVLKIYSNSDKLYLSSIGQGVMGTLLSTWGFEKGKWQELRIPVCSTFDKEAGDYLEGFQLAFVETVVIDSAKLVSLSANLTGNQVANFNMEEYSAMLAVTENFEWNSANRLKYSIKPEGVNNSDGGVLELYSLDYTSALQITFPKQVVVDEYSYLLLDLYETANDISSWTTRIAKFGAKAASDKEYGNAGISLTDYGHVKGEWNTVKISLIDFGYEVGDVLEGIQFVVQDSGKTGYKLYVDEIRVESMLDKINAMKDALSKGEVANYDDENYSMFVSTSGDNTTATIENGAVNIFSNRYNFQTFKFLIPQTVRDGDYLVIRAQANDRVRIAKDTLSSGGTAGRELFCWNPDNNPYSLGFSQNMQTVMIPVSVFGYKSGDVMDSICIGNWSNDKDTGTFAIDYIAYFNENDYANGTVADYAYAFSDYLALQKPEFYYVIYLDSPYPYTKAEKVAYDPTIGAVTVSPSGTNSYRAVRLSFLKPVTVTKDTMFVITMRYTPSTDNQWIYFKGKLLDNGLHERISMVTNSAFIDPLSIGETFDTVKFKGTTFYEVGDTVEYIDIAFQNGSVAFKSVAAYGNEIETLVFGDSYTDRKYWTNLESDLAQVNGYTIGVGGTTVADWTPRLEEIVAYNPKNIVIHLGVNDINKGATGVATAANICALLDSLQEKLPNTKIYYITISNNLNYTQKWTEYQVSNAEVIEYAKEKANVTIIDFATKQTEMASTWENSGYIVGDATHLTQEAYATLTEMVLTAIEGNS